MLGVGDFPTITLVSGEAPIQVGGTLAFDAGLAKQRP
jgi:hypothetical protein